MFLHEQSDITDGQIFLPAIFLTNIGEKIMKQKFLTTLALAACTIGVMAAEGVWHKVDVEAKVDGKKS